MALRRDRGVGSDVADAIEAEAQRWEQAAESGPMTFGRAWRFRQEMGRPEYWTNGPRGAMNPAHSHRRDLYRIVREEMLQAADAADPQAADVFRQASSRYATVRPLAEAADEATFRAAQNRQLSLTDTIALGGGVASGNPVVGLAAAGANRLLRGNEHRLMARYHERAAQLARTRPERLGRYAQPLATAAQRGPKAFAATYFTLWNREPEFRQAIQQTDEPADLAEEMTDE